MTDRDALAQRHMGLVHALCRRFADKGVEYEELFAAGCLGLTKALNGFDKSRGMQFSTYAFPVIAGEIKRLFRDGGAVKVSRTLRALSLKIARLNAENLRQNGAELTVSELAARLGVSAEQVTDAIGSARLPLSLTSVHDADGDPQTDVPVADMQEAVTERLSLEQAIAALPSDDKQLIRLRYFQSKTQAQTAAVLHTSQVQISRREKKILAQLREQMIC